MSEDEQSVRALAQLMGVTVLVRSSKNNGQSSLFPIQVQTFGTNYRVSGGYFKAETFMCSYFQTWKEALEAVQGITAKL